jgi:CubicO group peptidase (beta-lactamase class C family)
MTSVSRRTTLKAIAAALLTPFVSSGCGAPPARPSAILPGDYDLAFAHLRQWIEYEIQTANVTGLSIALLDDQQIIWSEGFGFANKAAGIRATGGTCYRAGSISKLFTAVAAMQLAEAGKLDIDAPLTRALPKFSIRNRTASEEPITPRMVMSHHSGLPSDRIEGMWTEHPAQYSSLVDATSDEYRAFPPNFVYAYSNLGYSLLGAAVEYVAGKAFEGVMREQLLAPLGMKDSTFEYAPPDGPRAALAYDEDGEPGRELPLRDIPAGGLNSTVTDLLQFARLMFGRGTVDGVSIAEEATIAEIQRPQNTACPLDVDLRVGLGWHYAPSLVRGAGPVLFHDGGTLHHRSVLVLLPRHRLAVAVMANSANATESVAKTAGYALSLLLEAGRDVTPHDGIAPSAPATRYAAVPSEAFPGRYVTELGLADIRQDGKQLIVEAGGMALATSRQANGYLKLEYRYLGLLRADIGRLGQFEFTRASIAGHEVLLARDEYGFYLAGEKIVPTRIPAPWLARLGSYRYIGDDIYMAGDLTEVVLKTDEGFLLVETRGKAAKQVLALEAITGDAAIVRGLGRSRGDTVHVRRIDGRETLHYAGLSFERTFKRTSNATRKEEQA